MRKLFLAGLLVACGTPAPAPSPYAAHSGSMALTGDGKTLFVVDPDADSVSQIDLASRARVREILLNGAHPAPEANGAFTPAVMPRALALSPDDETLYVTGERSGKLYALDVAAGTTRSSDAICSEPVGVVVSGDGRFVYVACTQDDAIVRMDAASLTEDARLAVATEPWALAFAPDGRTLYATHFLRASVTAIDPLAMSVVRTTTIADLAPRGDKRLAHGQPRGLYDAAVRPGGSELWITHTLLATDTAQPELDFESTVFPALSLVDEHGTVEQTLSTNAQDVPGVNGAFADIVSGPRAIAFTHDGAYALVADQDSEDVLVVDAAAHVEVALVRPLPGHQPEGIVVSPDDRFAYVQQRNTNDVAVLDLDRSGGALAVTVEPGTLTTVASDPMPAELRFGQHLFYSANSDEYPITRNHWVSCSSCHLEGRSDAVTWRFTQGPRDTPTNAGGVLGTGFLLRTADRNEVQDYWQTIDIEQGGTFDPNDPAYTPLLDAIAAYVNLGIPVPVPPKTDPTLVAKGAAVFQSAGCAGCHSGPRFTDSGSGNPSLDLDGPVILHDVGTCVAGGDFPDVAHEDIDGDGRAACAFDTPSLTGVASTPPYMHDGSAPTLKDAVDRMLAPSNAQGMSAADEAALVEYLRSL